MYVHLAGTNEELLNSLSLQLPVHISDTIFTVTPSGTSPLIAD